MAKVFRDGLPDLVVFWVGVLCWDGFFRIASILLGSVSCCFPVFGGGKILRFSESLNGFEE